MSKTLNVHSFNIESKDSMLRESVLFIGTQFSNLYTLCRVRLYNAGDFNHPDNSERLKGWLKEWVIGWGVSPRAEWVDGWVGGFKDWVNGWVRVGGL